MTARPGKDGSGKGRSQVRRRAGGRLGREAPPPVDLGKERRIREGLDELRALLDSGAVDAHRTRAMLAGDLETAAMADEETPTTIRAPRALLDRAEALAERLPRPPGSTGRPSRSSVLRLALERGIAALEEEASALPPPAGPDLRAELAELRARLDRLEADREGKE